MYVYMFSVQFTDKGGADLELVTCSGHGKNGALCILQVNGYTTLHTCTSLHVYIHIYCFVEKC